MRYTVTWVPSADKELANIWVRSSRRQAVADASDEMERQLKKSPDRVGLDWGGGERYLEIAPLAVHFIVLPDDRLVRVLRVWELPN